MRCNNCWSSRFGYPNDEGIPEHPIYGTGFDTSRSSILEISDSPWTRDLESQSKASARRIWGDRYKESRQPELHHFVIALKEATFECVAESVEVELFVESFNAAFAHVIRKLAEH